jgi:hypothetical protein
MPRALHALAGKVYHPQFIPISVNHHQHRVKPAFTSSEPCHAYRVAMDLGFDPNAWPRDSAADARNGAPEWLALRDRMGAAWSARRALAMCATASAIRSGSFNRTSAAAVAGLDALQFHVNPNALGNGKPDHASNDPAAEAILTGGRG